MAAAEAAGVWNAPRIGGWRGGAQEGEAGLLDRSSRAARGSRSRTPADRERVIAQLRRLHMTAAEIAEVLAMALSTVSAVLKRIGLGKRSRLLPTEPANRYERKRPGELVHLDIKKLGRIQPRRRASHDQRPPTKPERPPSPTGSRRARLGVRARRRRRRDPPGLRRGAPQTSTARPRPASSRVLSPGSPPSGSPSSGALRQRRLLPLPRARRRLRQLEIRHLFTRPYRPRTNGKAERFIQTLTNRWAYGAIYGRSAERTAALPGWLTHYNFTRPHGSLSHKPPGTRLQALTNPPWELHLGVRPMS